MHAALKVWPIDSNRFGLVKMRGTELIEVESSTVDRTNASAQMYLAPFVSDVEFMLSPCPRVRKYSKMNCRGWRMLEIRFPLF